MFVEPFAFGQNDGLSVPAGGEVEVSPLLAAAIPARCVPAPLSRLFRTDTVLGTQRSCSASSVGRKGGPRGGFHAEAMLSR